MQQYSFLTESKFNDEDLRNHETSAGVIKDGDKYVIQDHVKHDMLTFPIGKAKPNETPLQALKTELNEELGIKVIDAKELFYYDKDYDFDGKKVRIRTHVFEVLKYTGKIENKEPHKHRWIKFMPMKDVISSKRRIADCIVEYLKRKRP